MLRSTHATRVLAVAEPFGFGPTCSLIACREELRQALPDGSDFTWRFLGPDFSQEIVDRLLFDDCIFVEGQTEESRALAAQVEWADVVISGTEYRITDLIRERGKPLIVIDPLFWFWPSVPPLHVPGMTYICQNFPGVKERVAALPSHLRPAFTVTPPALYAPLLARPAKRETDHLLVNLCGFVNPVRTLQGYGSLIAQHLGEALRESRWRRVSVVGSARVLEEVKRALSDPRVTCQPLSHGEMLVAIASAGLLLTCPGLNSAIEAMSLGTPVAFLPPHNNSQAFQIDLFRKAAISPVDVRWESLAGIEAGWRTSVAVASLDWLAMAMNRCAVPGEGQRRLAKALASILSLDCSVLAQRQKRFLASLREPDLPSLRSVLESAIRNATHSIRPGSSSASVGTLRRTAVS